MVYVQNLKVKECLHYAIILVLFSFLEQCGISLFGNSQIGILLLITHIFSAISVGIILGIKDRLKKDKKNIRYLEVKKNICTFSNLGETLSNSIKNALTTVAIIRRFCDFFFSSNNYLRGKSYIGYDMLYY